MSENAESIATRLCRALADEIEKEIPTLRGRVFIDWPEPLTLGEPLPTPPPDPADVWDDGYQAAVDDHAGWDRTANPYRRA
jgi:hypothetical protein